MLAKRNESPFSPLQIGVQQVSPINRLLANITVFKIVVLNSGSDSGVTFASILAAKDDLHDLLFALRTGVFYLLDPRIDAFETVFVLACIQFSFTTILSLSDFIQANSTTLLIKLCQFIFLLLL